MRHLPKRARRDAIDDGADGNGRAGAGFGARVAVCGTTPVGTGDGDARPRLSHDGMDRLGADSGADNAESSGLEPGVGVKAFLGSPPIIASNSSVFLFLAPGGRPLPRLTGAASLAGGEGRDARDAGSTPHAAAPEPASPAADAPSDLTLTCPKNSPNN